MSDLLKKLYSKKSKNDKTSIDFDNIKIGREFTIIAGPCAVESKAQIFKIANFLEQTGIKILRASIFKPRTSPYSFQGLGEEGYDILQQLKNESDLLIETELMDVRHMEKVSELVDIIRIGSRNMFNYDLLREVGKLKKPVLLKRAWSATIEEFLLAAEYILKEGNQDVILCERGIRTFETSTRNTLDIAAISVLKRETHLPIIVDPSHAAGDSRLVPDLSKASIAAGADGLMIEIHPEPQNALSDGKQSLNFDEFNQLLKEINPYIKLAKESKFH